MSTGMKPQPESQQIAVGKPPRCLKISQDGIQTANQFARFMSALMSDLIEGAISPQVGNATVNAGGKLLKVVEMQYRYGTTAPDGTKKVLDLIGDPVIE